jgi:2-dehydropantoate 2-reductase
MKICIFGAGAIGGFIGVLLARSGQEVSFVAARPQVSDR